MRKKSARRDLLLLLVLDALLIAGTYRQWNWGLSMRPPVRPWLSAALMVLGCGDTLRRVLRFRELTGHWPDLRKRDLGAEDS